MYLLCRGLASTHQFVHSNTDHVLCGDDRARDGEDTAILVLVTDAALLGRHPDCASSRMEGLYRDREIRHEASGAVGPLVDVLDKVREAEVVL